MEASIVQALVYSVQYMSIPTLTNLSACNSDDLLCRLARERLRNIRVQQRVNVSRDCMKKNIQAITAHTTVVMSDTSMRASVRTIAHHARMHEGQTRKCGANTMLRCLTTRNCTVWWGDGHAIELARPELNTLELYKLLRQHKPRTNDVQKVYLCEYTMAHNTTIAVRELLVDCALVAQLHDSGEWRWLKLRA
jgi:hypothetical protein